MKFATRTHYYFVSANVTFASFSKELVSTFFTRSKPYMPPPSQHFSVLVLQSVCPQPQAAS